MIYLSEKILAENCEYEVAENPESGSSLQSYVTTTYDKLYNLFGTPSYSTGDPYDKVQTQWAIDGKVYFTDEYGDKDYETIKATVYNWKTGGTPTEEYEWHIGGTCYEAVEFIEEILNGQVQPDYNWND
ncbi:MAG: hypothetical protein CMA63_00420 [Euryarchaeota archaeon]|nr:hypothetical protein [Euryarchaeota archaeon]|tara:strand:+ start:1160 stop:1546 length:387 start_codon:yes stop_codon:yes gene_type:complete